MAGSVSGAVSKAKAALAQEGPPKRERFAISSRQVLRRAVRPAAASEKVVPSEQARLQRNRKAGVWAVAGSRGVTQNPKRAGGSPGQGKARGHPAGPTRRSSGPANGGSVVLLFKRERGPFAGRSPQTLGLQ